ncbi:hypothetical protein EG329_001485 [Mollisiaceae sp. DMI_Dod_QoI]|nr:hypothetical protein EG329_001485 [Helotiales sp. DMI_Dod_QoI]
MTSRDNEKGIRVAVIGGGPVGVVTLKTLLRNSAVPIQAQLFEAQGAIGGSFFNAYENGALVSSKQLTAFSDFRLPKHCPTYVTFAYYATYIEHYCSHFHLFPHINLRSRVLKVEILEEEAWRYRIHYSSVGEDESITQQIYECSHIAVCTGLQSKPYLLDIPGLKDFRGKAFHSADYKSPSQLTNEDVVIIGSGESAMDIAYAGILARAKSVTMCFRSGFLSIPRSLDLRIFGKPLGSPLSLDWLNANLFETAYVHPFVAKSRLRWKFVDMIMKWVLYFLAENREELVQEVGRLPFRSWRNVYVNRNEAIVPYLNAPYKKVDAILDSEACRQASNADERWINTCTIPSHISPEGDVTFSSDLNRKDYRRVVNGPPIRASTVILCTGYKTLGSLLPKPYSDLSRATCRHMLSPEDPTVVHMCFVRSWIGSSGPLAEMQAMWYTAYLDGRMSLPTSKAYYALRSVNIHGHPGVDFPSYLATLASDIGAKPNIFVLWWEYGYKVLLAYCFGGSFVSFYRLIGPFKEKDLMKELVEGELWDTVKRKGLLGNFLFGLLPMIVFGLLNGVAWLCTSLVV